MYVYFIQEGERGPVKIGRAKDLLKRIETLQIGNSRELKLIAKLPCQSERQAHEMEQRIHRRLARFRVRGEWFRFRALRELREIKDQRRIPKGGPANRGQTIAQLRQDQSVDLSHQERAK